LNNSKDAHISGELLEIGRAEASAALQQLASRLDGLTEAEAGTRLKQYGLNVIAREQRLSALIRLLSNVKNPLAICLDPPVKQCQESIGTAAHSAGRSFFSDRRLARDGRNFRDGNSGYCVAFRAGNAR